MSFRTQQNHAVFSSPSDESGSGLADQRHPPVSRYDRDARGGAGRVLLIVLLTLVGFGVFVLVTGLIITQQIVSTAVDEFKHGFRGDDKTLLNRVDGAWGEWHRGCLNAVQYKVTRGSPDRITVRQRKGGTKVSTIVGAGQGVVQLRDDASGKEWELHSIPIGWERYEGSSQHGEWLEKCPAF